MPTKQECQKMVGSLGWLCGVSPKLIATRLLSTEDKTDMLNGNLDMDVLECAVNVWKDNGMPDYVKVP